MQEKLEFVKDILKEAELYSHACHVVNFDLETICPPDGREEQGEVAAFLSNQAFRILKREDFIRAAEELYARREELGEYDRRMAVLLHRGYLRTKNVTPETDHAFAKVMHKAYVDWLRAKEASDFRLFRDSLAAVRDVNLRQASLRESDPDLAPTCTYDVIHADYEFGMTVPDLDRAFGRCKERLVPLLKKIMASKKRIRTDFLSKPVTDEQQKAMGQYLLTTIGYDFRRGAITTTEHPFTDGLGRNDVRVTTHYYPTAFISAMYSTIHEGGHALFEQKQPVESFDYYLTEGKTMGMHESVSRFYENRIGRSKEFIHLIYPKVCEIFPQVMEDVSEAELYEAVNHVHPGLIRTESDEFTYTFHIMIRYEIEKEVLAGRADIDSLPELWNDKYEEYLGVRPGNDAEGILQDVHWSSGFGYFPTYAIGNMYNAMYINRMKEDFDLASAVGAGDFQTINSWMAEHVFRKADMLSPKDWIRDITGRDFTPDDFLDYLTEKYSALYELQ